MTAGVTKRENGLWEGVVRVEGKVVWQCGHSHINRDISGRRGRSAKKCAELYLRDPENWEENIKKSF